MAREIAVPELGEDVTEAKVLSVRVSAGDEVKRDQGLLELETDKAAFDMPSPAAGVVKAVRVSEGDSVSVGEVVIELEEEVEERAREDEPDDAEAAGASASGASGEGEEHRPAGSHDREDEGYDQEEDDGGDQDEEAGDREQEAGPPAGAEGSEAPAEGGARRTPPLPAAPSVRRLARQLGLALEEVRGTGPEGRISEEDVTDHARALLVRTRRRAPGGATPALPDFSRFGEVAREPLAGIRRRIADDMARSWHAIPHVTQHDRADLSELEPSRRRLSERASREGVSITLTAVAVRVAAAALQAFPRFNASLDVERQEAVLKRYVNVAVAVDTEHGLVAPVIRDADRKGLLEIARELDVLAERARQRRSRPEDLAGAGFTVTNLGGLGTTTFSPLVHWPEVAVLGMGRASEELRPGEAGPRTRLLLPLSLSYDHRWIDGADAARFLRWFAEALENPLLLQLGT